MITVSLLHTLQAVPMHQAQTESFQTYVFQNYACPASRITLFQALRQNNWVRNSSYPLYLKTAVDLNSFYPASICVLARIFLPFGSRPFKLPLD